VITSEILEHVPADGAVIDELIRVIDELIRMFKVGGRLAVTMPRWFPSRYAGYCPTTITRSGI
jgi:hypothetical protein